MKETKIYEYILEHHDEAVSGELPTCKSLIQMPLRLLVYRRHKHKL